MLCYRSEGNRNISCDARNGMRQKDSGQTVQTVHDNLTEIKRGSGSGQDMDSLPLQWESSSICLRLSFCFLSLTSLFVLCIMSCHTSFFPSEPLNWCPLSFLQSLLQSSLDSFIKPRTACSSCCRVLFDETLCYQSLRVGQKDEILREW